MTTIEEEDTKYRKRAPKHKDWRVVWTWSGTAHRSPDKLHQFLYGERVRKYATQQQAIQALVDWQQGRGLLAQACTTARGWSARVVPPTL